MDLFVIDTQGDREKFDEEDQFDQTIVNQDASSENESEDDDDYGGLPPPSKDISHIIASATSSKKSSILGGFGKKKTTIKDFSETGELKLKDRDITALDELIAIPVKQELKKLIPIEHQRLDTVALSDRKLIKMRRVSKFFLHKLLR